MSMSGMGCLQRKLNILTEFDSWNRGKTGGNASGFLVVIIYYRYREINKK